MHKPQILISNCKRMTNDFKLLTAGKNGQQISIPNRLSNQAPAGIIYLSRRSQGLFRDNKSSPMLRKSGQVDSNPTVKISATSLPLSQRKTRISRLLQESYFFFLSLSTKTALLSPSTPSMRSISIPL